MWVMSDDDGLAVCDSCECYVPEEELEWFETAHMTLESPAEGLYVCETCRNQADDYEVDAYLARMDEEVYVSDYDYN